jgi:glycerol-3-phosphate dehydrogenase
MGHAALPQDGSVPGGPADDPTGASGTTDAAAGDPFDVVVVGGGINGAGIARDLAGRGARVMLVERDDLAAHTSSASTKLIHGGLRYLEHREFGLVRKALAEREGLLRGAPHIMWPLRFVMPHDPSMRPAWMIRAGLFLYDHLARRELLPASRGFALAGDPAGAPLLDRFTRAFEYADGWVDDARLVVACAQDAAARGAQVRVRTACVQARREAGLWRIVLEGPGGAREAVRARALVNAAGPWAARFLGEALGRPRPRALRLVRGSHLVVRRLFDHDRAYLFQNADGRVLFAIPYEGDFTLLGTTDVEHRESLDSVETAPSEVAYLCEQAGRFLRRPPVPADVVWHFSGVRPLLDDDSGDPAAITRDYALELELDGAGPAAAANGAAQGAAAPLLSVWGGKITTFRRLAEEAADRLAPLLGLPGGAWTRGAVLAGGDLSVAIRPTGRPDADFAAFVAELGRRHPEVAPARRTRLARAYGAQALALLDAPQGEEVAPGLHEVELAHLRRAEWAGCADDVLWRRSKLGLHLSPAQREAVARWCERNWGCAPGASPTACARSLPS